MSCCDDLAIKLAGLLDAATGSGLVEDPPRLNSPGWYVKLSPPGGFLSTCGLTRLGALEKAALWLTTSATGDKTYRQQVADAYNELMVKGTVTWPRPEPREEP